MSPRGTGMACQDFFKAGEENKSRRPDLHAVHGASGSTIKANTGLPARLAAASSSHVIERSPSPPNSGGGTIRSGVQRCRSRRPLGPPFACTRSLVAPSVPEKVSMAIGNLPRRNTASRTLSRYSRRSTTVDEMKTRKAAGLATLESVSQSRQHRAVHRQRDHTFTVIGFLRFVFTVSCTPGGSYVLSRQVSPPRQAKKPVHAASHFCE
jgi:hypothetical protein